MKAIYDVDPGDVFWAASDVGWVVGHSYIVYAPLLQGCTTILYEGKPVGTPDAGAFWRVISQHKVKCLFTAPTAFRAIKREDPNADVDEEVRPLVLQDPVPGRRAPGPGHPALGAEEPGHAGDRPLVADRDRLGHRRQLHGPAPVPGQGGLADQGRARLGPGRSWGPTSNRSSPGKSALWWPSCRCRPAHCRRCGTTTRDS